MRRVVPDGCAWVVVIAVSAGRSFAQRALTWQEVRDKFEAANPTLRAGQIGVDESARAGDHSEPAAEPQPDHSR